MSEYVYVAADPKQPGAAYAIIVDDGSDLPHMHKRLAEWAAAGAIPMRVTRDEGIAMIGKWTRPQRKLL